MGVPAFYRWLSEKYKNTVVYAKEERVPVIEGRRRFDVLKLEEANPNGIEFDNLYIDMNGIIHPCAHPENGEQPRTEEEMFIRLMDYVDRLVACVRPRRLLYMAIDGVAPRAKMNQQRARRFRSGQEARERKVAEDEARSHLEALGHKLPEKETTWDSNVITPGTKFMAKLSKYMRYYVRDRMNNCPYWKNIKVIFSDAGVPGEGEHKLMSYIRTQRCQPGYDPNQHHVLHGLDADLIMLGLATHEVKFSILREEVVFGKPRGGQKPSVKIDSNGVPSQTKRGKFGEHTVTTPYDLKPFQILHISILREYLEIEFKPLAERLPFPYDFERMIDDFVFLCFFVGNDFLPHLPCLEIRDGAVDYLLLIYAKLLPSLGGYLTRPGGHVDLEKVDVILAEVGSMEETYFKRRAESEKREARIRAAIDRRKKYEQEYANGGRDLAQPVKKQKVEDGQGKEIHVSEKDLKDKIETIQTTLRKEYVIQDVVRLGEPGWKTRYYEDKLKAHDFEMGGGREKVFKSYVEGLCWVMRYYYSGVASWNWFYPFHYGPFASDLKNIDRFQVKFDVGEPFRPFEQLMGVFPADSRHAIPKPYQWLMTDPESPVIDFYPLDIPYDPNGIPQPWRWIILLPFIDEKRLLNAMEPLNEKLSENEKKRNERYGKEIIFFHHSILNNHLIPTKNKSIDLLNFGINGRIHYFESCDFPIGCTIPSPQISKIDLQDIPNNGCLSFHYEMPQEGLHVSALLPGAIPPERTLLSQLEQVIEIPNLNRNRISILDLTGAIPGTTTTAISKPATGKNKYFNPPNDQSNNSNGNKRQRSNGPNKGNPSSNFQSNQSQRRSPPRYQDSSRPEHYDSNYRSSPPRPGSGQYDSNYRRSPPRPGSGQYDSNYRRSPPRSAFHYDTNYRNVPSGVGPPPIRTGPPRPNLEILRQGLLKMHAQKGTNNDSKDTNPSARRYDR